VRRRQFIRELVEAGCYLQRHGKKHDIYANPRTGKKPLFHAIPTLKRVSANSSEDSLDSDRETFPT
jgi:mRNA interferase HicA